MYLNLNTREHRHGAQLRAGVFGSSAAFFECEIAFQNQGGRNGVNDLFPLFGILAAVEENIVGVNGGSALIPEDDR